MVLFDTVQFTKTQEDEIQVMAWLLQSGLKFRFGDIFGESEHSSSQHKCFRDIILEQDEIANNRWAVSNLPITENEQQLLSRGEEFCNIIQHYSFNIILELGKVKDSCVLIPVFEKLNSSQR